MRIRFRLIVLNLSLDSPHSSSDGKAINNSEDIVLTIT